MEHHGWGRLLLNLPGPGPGLKMKVESRGSPTRCARRLLLRAPLVEHPVRMICCERGADFIWAVRAGLELQRDFLQTLLR